jgi:hypothetical protein
VFKIKVVPYLPFYYIAKFDKFWSNKMVVFIIYKLKSVWKIEKMFGFMIWARPGGTVARVIFKPSAPRASPTRDRGAALHRVPAEPASRRPAVADVRDRDHSPSLSSNYKEENAGGCFLPNAKVGTAIHSSLASSHLALPLGDSSCLADSPFLALLLP